VLKVMVRRSEVMAYSPTLDWDMMEAPCAPDGLDSRLGLIPPPMSWLKGRLVADEVGGAALEAFSLLPVAGIEPW